MKYDKLESILLEYRGSSVSFPFDQVTPVFKVGAKMFALVSVDKKPLSINLKCDPEDALILRSQFAAILPGYHMNKDHWNTLVLDGSIEEKLLLKLIEDSYKLVLQKMTKKDQNLLANQ